MSYIVPKEIPMCCGLCPCFHAEHPMYCQAVKADKNKRIYAPYGEGRPDWCPLIEVHTPHGRLGDLDKLKAYEDKRSDRIEVGDEVRAEEGHVFVVTGITDKGSIYGFDKDGMWLVRVKNRLCKTGKHYDIASILEAMRE